MSKKDNFLKGSTFISLVTSHVEYLFILPLLFLFLMLIMFLYSLAIVFPSFLAGQYLTQN